jgi:tRNA-modifying protein YgfZ
MTFPADYRALLEEAAIGEIAPRGQIGIAGKDRAAYLQGLLTNDIAALTPGSGCYAAWLTPQGRLVTDMHVLESGDMILLDVPANLVDLTMQRLDQFLFAEDVQFSDLRGALQGVWIHGPASARVIEQVASGIEGLAGWPEYRNARAAFGSGPIVVARIDQLGVPGYCVYVDPAQAPALLQSLEGAGAVRASGDAIEAARIEAGTPVFGIDMDNTTIPLEAAIEQRAISFTKGCYVGQEVVIRVLHRGHGRVAKRLVALRFEGSDAVPPETKLLGDGREVGTVP